MIWTALLGLGFIFALAGDFVLWAKLDEQKQKTADEHANYIAALRLHNTAAEMAQEKDAEIDGEILTLSAYCDILKQERDALQDFKSKTLCPHNDHVWRDGVCVKCGRAKGE